LNTLWLLVVVAGVVAMKHLLALVVEQAGYFKALTIRLLQGLQ
jgi:hypothetical protein